MSWQPSYSPASFPYKNVHVIGEWRWTTTFRFKVGHHLSRSTFVFDDINAESGGTIHVSRKRIHFITKDKKLDWKAICICHKHGFNHSVMWEGDKTGWHHVIFNNHRLIHRVLRVFRANGIKVSVHGVRTYLIQSSDQ